MHKLLDVIADFEADEAACRYVINVDEDKIRLSVSVQKERDEEVFDYCLESGKAVAEVLDEVKKYLPNATVCCINGKILIDNMK